jgi:ABC-type Mn2+/Zn2+ transport system ATPase subunit
VTELLRCADVSVGYGSRVVAGGISFSLDDGSYLGIVGPNGCGKTTLLKAILGILPPHSGRIEWRSGARPRIGYVPQRDAIDAIYPFSALDVVALALGTDQLFRPATTRAMRDEATRALETVGLADHRNKSYPELSGGQRQRVLMARAFATRPELLALDEPTNGLDPGGSETLLDIVSSMHRDRKMTIVLVSHDLSLVARRSTHALAMFENRYIQGPTRETLTGEHLTQLYNYPLVVKDVGGLMTVLPGAEARTTQ